MSDVTRTLRHGDEMHVAGFFQYTSVCAVCGATASVRREDAEMPRTWDMPPGWDASSRSPHVVRFCPSHAHLVQEHRERLAAWQAEDAAWRREHIAPLYDEAARRIKARCASHPQPVFRIEADDVD